MKVRVAQVIRETAQANSLVLEPAEEDSGRFRYRPGQFLTVRVPTTRDGGAARCYSLSSSPECGEPPKVTVKRTAGGYASNWICDNVVEGDTLDVLRPAGTFTVDSFDEDPLLFAGGSGITPVMSILKSCLRAGTGAPTLVYANRDEDSVIFRDELAALSEEYGDRLTVLHWLESVQGLPTAAGLRALARPYAQRQAFVCGPGVFMELATTALADLGVAGDRVKTERFFSYTTNPFAEPAETGESAGASEQVGTASTAEVELDGETHTVAVPEGGRLLDALLAAGLDAPFSCREGACSACACMLVEGEAAMDNNEVLDERDLADGLLLACQARPTSERIKITYDG